MIRIGIRFRFRDGDRDGMGMGIGMISQGKISGYRYHHSGLSKLIFSPSHRLHLKFLLFFGFGL